MYTKLLEICNGLYNKFQRVEKTNRTLCKFKTTPNARHAILDIEKLIKIKDRVSGSIVDRKLSELTGFL